MTQHSPLPWSCSLSNGVKPNDDYYEEFFEIRDANNKLVAKVEEKDNADFIVDFINTFARREPT